MVLEISFRLAAVGVRSTGSGLSFAELPAERADALPAPMLQHLDTAFDPVKMLVLTHTQHPFSQSSLHCLPCQGEHAGGHGQDHHYGNTLRTDRRQQAEGKDRVVDHSRITAFVRAGSAPRACTAQRPLHMGLPDGE